MSLPIDRSELKFRFEALASKRLLQYPDASAEDILDLVVPELVSAVPVSAFEPTQPSDEGILFYHGDVTAEEVEDFQHDLVRTHLNLEPSRPITLNLSSPGGNVFSGLALVSTISGLQRQGRDVNVHVQGIAMSMGSIVVQAATRRTMEPSAVFMAHEVSWGTQGSASDHEESQVFGLQLQDIVYGFYSRRSGQPVSYYQRILKKKNWYLNAQQALDEGLIDAIVDIPVLSLTPAKELVKSTRAKRTR